MQLLITVTTAKAASVLQPLINACVRSPCTWGLFLTNDAVILAKESWLSAATKDLSDVWVCQESWSMHIGNTECELSLGSQTNHSEMIGKATRVLSL